jgi:hypothetical protein
MEVVQTVATFGSLSGALERIPRMEPTTPTYEQHPLASRYIPAAAADELQDLRASIRRGFDPRYPCFLFEGLVLVGWSRYHCALAEGVEPVFREYDGDDPVRFLLLSELPRRSLSAAKRLQIAEALRPELEREAREREARGKPGPADPSAGMRQGQGKVSDAVAEAAGVSTRTAENFHTVQVKGTPALQAAVLNETVSITDGAAVANEPAAVQDAAVGAVQGGAAKTARQATQTPKELLCDHCRSEGATPGCRGCRDVRAQAKARRRKARKKRLQALSGVQDAFKNEVPAKCRDAYCDPWIQETYDLLAVTLGKLLKARLADGMAKRKNHYPFFNAQDFIDGYGFATNYLDQLVQHFKENRPAGVCPACRGQGCSHCRQSGLVPRALYKQLKEEHH